MAMVPILHRHHAGHSLRSAPARIGLLEDQLEALAERLPDPKTDGLDRTNEVRIDNLAEIVGRLAKRLDRIDKRSARSRRKLAVITDQVADTIS
jgi:hypothetical protein